MSTELPRRTANCADHGEYQAINYLGSIWSKCPACVETERATRERKEREAQDAARIQRWAATLGHAQIPERFMDRTLDSYRATTPEQKHALRFARSFAENFPDALKTGRNALFVGTPGTGKTHLAVGIALHVMQSGQHSALFTTVLRAIRRVKDTWSRAHAKESEGQAVAALVFPDLLILDELGVQYGSEAEKTILFDILNDRYEQRKPTIFLSNLELDEVQAYLGQRVFSRLREDGGEYVPFKWEDYRGRQPDERP